MNSISGRDPHTGRTFEVAIREGIIAAITDAPSADPDGSLRVASPADSTDINGVDLNFGWKRNIRVPAHGHP